MDRVGSMRHKITIEQPTNTPDGMGGFTQSWSPFISAWAAINPLTANERLFAQKLEQDTSHKVIIRYRAGVTSRMRINYTVGASTRYLQIHGVINEREYNDYLTLLCKEGVGS